MLFHEFHWPRKMISYLKLQICLREMFVHETFYDGLFKIITNTNLIKILFKRHSYSKDHETLFNSVLLANVHAYALCCTRNRFISPASLSVIHNV